MRRSSNSANGIRQKERGWARDARRLHTKESNMVYCAYVLTDVEGVPRYVGQGGLPRVKATANVTSHRFSRKLLLKAVVLAESQEDSLRLEQGLIQLHRKTILNHNDFGNTRYGAANFMHGKPLSSTHKQKLSLATKGRSKTPAHKDKIRLALLGREISWGAAISETKRGARWISNGAVERVIQRCEHIPAGWVFGRRPRSKYSGT